ncbi:hypothetical protein B0H14DRAFT_2726840 [Mycena olivaceomarginata]|nr:hypothetical protein B0H14DRAFT_2726840 [Mycena olivaceomarginata]
MDPQCPAYMNGETSPQIYDRLQFYRRLNVKFLEYFPDGSSRELEHTDALAPVSLLATTAFPNIQLAQVQQMMNTLRYFLFDLQNSRCELVPHGGPPQTLSNLVFYRQYPEGYGIILPVQPYACVRYSVPPTLRNQLAQTPLEDEVQLQQSVVANGNSYYLDVRRSFVHSNHSQLLFHSLHIPTSISFPAPVACSIDGLISSTPQTLINRVIANFRREVEKMEMQARLQAAPQQLHFTYRPPQSQRKSQRRLHWSMVA